MRLFLSAGEPSGDLHGGNLIRSLRRLCPEMECAGLGGDRMTEAGCDLLYPLAQHPFIGAIRVLGSVPFFIRLLYRIDHYLRTRRPQAVVLIDNPGLNWWVARVARIGAFPFTISSHRKSGAGPSGASARCVPWSITSSVRSPSRRAGFANTRCRSATSAIPISTNSPGSGWTRCS